MEELYAEINGQRVRVIRAGANVALVDIKDSELLNVRDYNFAVAEGLVTGTQNKYFLGYNGDVDEVREDLWPLGGIYQFPSIPQQLIVFSSSPNDMVSGTGARYIDIHYLDSNYDSYSETIYLSGTHQVPTQATNILRINDAHVMGVGTNEVSVGNISITHLSTTGTYGYIEAGHNASRVGIYTVPRGMIFYIEEWLAGVGGTSGNKYAEFSLRTTTSHESERTDGIFHQKSGVILYDSSLPIPLQVPIRCVEKSDVKISVISESNANSKCAGEIRGILKANGQHTE